MLKTIGIIIIALALFGGFAGDILLWAQSAIGVVFAWLVAIGISKLLWTLLIVWLVCRIIRFLFR